MHCNVLYSVDVWISLNEVGGGMELQHLNIWTFEWSGGGMAATSLSWHNSTKLRVKEPGRSGETRGQTFLEFSWRNSRLLLQFQNSDTNLEFWGTLLEFS